MMGRVMRVSRLEIATVSNVGRRRRNNEDFHRVAVYPTARGNLILAAVADGMGGSEAGEWASKLAIEGLTEAVRAYTAQLETGRPAVPLERVMDKAFRLAQHRILQEGERAPERKGMGTTLTAMLLNEWNKSGVIGHVGDTRAYRRREGRWQQLTTDHSWVAQQVRQGLLTPHQAETHPWRHMLTQALGLAEVKHDLMSISLAPDETIVLTTDGLYNLVLPEEWQTTLDLQSSLEHWVGLALERGGTDNITAVAARWR
ncbi:MAG: serine/threonine-protein phosphatase [Meiothermus sp.]